MEFPRLPSLKLADIERKMTFHENSPNYHLIKVGYLCILLFLVMAILCSFIWYGINTIENESAQIRFRHAQKKALINEVTSNIAILGLARKYPTNQPRKAMVWKKARTTTSTTKIPDTWKHWIN